MNFLQLSSEYPPQQVFGLGRYVSGLSCELVRQGHAVHVITNSLGGAGREEKGDGVFVHRVDFPPPPKPPGPGAPVMAFNLQLQQRALSLAAPEVVVSHDWLTALAGHRLARRWDVPHVWTVHDTVHGKRFGKVRDPEDLLAFDIEKWAAKTADLVLVNSRAVFDEIRDVYEGDPLRMKLLHCAIDPDCFVSRQPASRIAAFRSVLAAPEEILVTYAGRLDAEKGVDTLVNAFWVAHGRDPRLRLALAGRGALEPAIREHLQRQNLEQVVRLCGYLEGEPLKHFYIVSDLHVCPSTYEPFGLVAAEAMAAGTPVIVSATGGLTDIVSDPSVGRTVPPTNIQALVDAILELAGDAGLRKRLGSAGRKHVREQFSWPGMARKAAEFYASSRGGRN